jgi:nucleoside-diphosphate-sugar epimerase
MSKTQQHVLVLGATGVSGLAFLHEVTSRGPSAPLVTLYTRLSGRSKLPADVADNSNVRIAEGGLTDRAAVKKALSADGSFPQVTAVISFLGAYASLYYTVTRQTPHPIADAISSTILPVMREVGVRRIIALSTPGGFQYPEETEKMSWGFWLHVLPTRLFVPQGNAEMTQIARVLILAGAQDKELEWTIFRIPMLNNGDANAVVSAGEWYKDYKGGWDLSRGSQARWVLNELEERKHVRRAPMVGNVAY